MNIAKKILLPHVCEAQNELERENVDYIFKYKTADNEYESEVAHFIEENEVDRPGKYTTNRRYLRRIQLSVVIHSGKGALLIKYLKLIFLAFLVVFISSDTVFGT